MFLQQLLLAILGGLHQPAPELPGRAADPLDEARRDENCSGTARRWGTDDQTIHRRMTGTAVCCIVSSGLKKCVQVKAIKGYIYIYTNR